MSPNRRAGLKKGFYKAILFFKEQASWPRLLGVAMAIGGLFLLRK